MMLQSKYVGYDNSRNGPAGPSDGNGRPVLMMAGRSEVIFLEALLKASEASGLLGVSLRHVRRMAQSGKLPYQIHTNAQNRPEYLIPLSSLPEQAQKKYIDQHRPAAMDAPAKHSGKKQGSATRPLESYSGEERAEISYWLTLVDRWQEYRRKAGGRKAECDEAFVRLCQLEDPQKRQISVETLYRKWAAIREGDLDALVDKRGKARKGKTVLLPEIEQEFLSLYLDEAQLPIPRCVALTEQWARENMPTALPLPSYHTFYRKAKAVPYAVTVLCREGEKAYYDKCSPYIRREYESISANDFWIGDTHTLDVESMGPDGTLHRLYLSAWLDARSGIFTGWYVTSNPGSQATLNALRKGISARGIPLNVYVDNGREFLTYDIGGRGHRAKKRLADGSEPFAPPGVFERLGIKMTNAIVRNARAKLVERRFEDFKNYVSRLFPTYTGGNVVEKPNRLKYVLKQGDHVPTDAEVIAAVDTLIEGYLNCEPYGGSVAEDKGKSRVEVWRESLPNGAVRQPASESDLQLMLMRTSKPVRVTRRGVTLKIHGLELDFYTPELANLRMKDKVYLRYDPEDLSKVRVYDMEDRYLTEAPQSKLTAGYLATQEQIAELMAAKRKAEKAVREYGQALRLPDDPERALNLATALARHNLEELELAPKPNCIELRRAEQEEPLLRAVGDIDIGAMTENLIRQRGGFEDGEDL